MIRRHTAAAYFGLAFAVSWLFWLPRIASEQGWWARDVPEWWHYAGAAGPVTAAFVVAVLVDGRAGAGALLAQYHPSRVRTGYLLFVLASLLTMFATGLVVERLVEGDWPAYSELAKTNNLPAIGLPLTFLVHLLTFGIGEETGWRGFALPRLQETHRALPATAILFAGWATWHVPSFFENPDFRDMSMPMLVGWTLGLALGAIFLTWLYNSTAASLLTIVVWHGLFNTITASEAASGAIAAVVSTGVMMTALAVLALAGPAELRGRSRGAERRVRWSTLVGAEVPVSERV